MTEAAAGALPDAAEARSWVGLALDEAGGRPAGRVDGLYVDAESGAPAWLIVTLLGGDRRRFFGLRRGSGKAVAVPLRECAAMPARAWTAQAARALRSAPAIDPARPLLREHEAAICTHYGIGERIGRHAEIAARPDGAITAQPA